MCAQTPGISSNLPLLLRTAVCLRANVLGVWWLCLLAPVTALGMPASPHPYQVKQPDGTVITLYIRGDEYFHWEEDANGYTVMRDANGIYVFATLDAQSNMTPTRLVVGVDDPGAAGLQPKTLPPPEVRSRQRALAQAQIDQLRGGVAAVQVPTTGTVENIVIMMRFSNHRSRTLPSNGDINTLFNNVGWSAVAPTGSVRDVYLENSYGQLTLNSTVFGWVDLPNTEQYYANDNSGLDSTIWQAITAALNAADPLIDFRQFDDDGDGFVDAIAFIHSGYGAEWGATDSYGTPRARRIWSHYWAIPTWTSREGVKVSPYHISPGLWETSGTAPGRIGVISHETGHFLGLPDLYDTDGSSSGIGSWCMMANPWGWSPGGWLPATQLNPPHFSAWCKQRLAWVTPTILSVAGNYTARQVEQFQDIYRINAGFPSGEYLLIENRQPYGFESTIPQGGLAIWHIDELKSDNRDEGYPGQPGWPGNNRHYMVALLQADGSYNLERPPPDPNAPNRGDAGDVYQGRARAPRVRAGVSQIDAETTPNTHRYQSGVVFPTFNRVRNISVSGATMTFNYDSQAPGPNAQMIVLLDRTGSMQAPRNITSTRCADALTQAIADVNAFFTRQPDRRVAVWAFASIPPHPYPNPGPPPGQSLIVDLSGGFVNQRDALDALTTLNLVPCEGWTPLAQAICQMADEFPSGLSRGDKVLAISSDGEENYSLGNCAGPASVSIEPPYDLGSWQSEVRLRLLLNAVVQVRYWGTFASTSSVAMIDAETGQFLGPGVSDQVFFQDLAESTGGTYVQVDDADPNFPEPTGACCDQRIADAALRCRDDLPESACVINDPDQVSWYKFTRCADLSDPCLEHTGACCDQDTFGACQEGVPASQCSCKKCVFYKDTPCSEIECLHNPIPTVSQWGLVVLTLLLLTGAKVYFGRRSQAAISR